MSQQPPQEPIAMPSSQTNETSEPHYDQHQSQVQVQPLKMTLQQQQAGQSGSSAATAILPIFPISSNTKQYFVSAAIDLDENKYLWIGDLQEWMDEHYLLKFQSQAAAERALQSYNGLPMPSAEQKFRMNWTTQSNGEKRQGNHPTASKKSGIGKQFMKGKDIVTVSPTDRSFSGEEWTVFVDNLSKKVSRRELREILNHYGRVLRVFIVIFFKKPHYKSSIFAFVQYAKEEGRRRVIQNIHGTLIDGKSVLVGVAKYNKAIKREVGERRFMKVANKSARKDKGSHEEEIELSRSLRDGRTYKDFERG
ncbi:polyadenylate-binding protein RBP47-like [Hibiscus syriacus]|uniref:polyadenylate-binding protein RBP47-like n=1 Tax=Hibiscus syriacus TaxID=106335 RepID=UPI0019206FBB|nr:polyadenylate-binding protein RBP47-like [Hibiscus syriacus]